MTDSKWVESEGLVQLRVTGTLSKKHVPRGKKPRSKNLGRGMRSEETAYWRGEDDVID